MEYSEPDVGRPSWMPRGDALAAVVPAGQFLVRALIICSEGASTVSRRR